MEKYENPKYQDLVKFLERYADKKVAIAFSGGVDSTLLLKIMREITRSEVYTIMASSDFLPIGDVDKAKEIAKSLGVNVETVDIDVLSDPEIVANPENRCYLCKSKVFSEIIKKGQTYGVEVYMDGTNTDDMNEYRPGIQALEELGVISPFRMAEVAKRDIREISRHYGLSTATKPSSPCLATRFPYGTSLHPENFRKVQAGEDYLKSLGFYNVRVRVHGDIARIELDIDSFGKVLDKREEIVAKFKEIGYPYITLDIEGFRSGSMDIHIEKEKNKK